MIPTDDPYLAPEARSAVLYGQVHNHPRFNDGTSVHTTRLRGRKGDSVFTRNTEYILGTIDPGYEKAYPGARERLMKSLPEIT